MDSNNKTNRLGKMKMIFMLSTVLAMLAGSLLSSCGSSKKEAQIAEEQDSVEISVPKKVSSNHGKVLVAYFTVPETDGVDASSGASRVNVNDKMMGNTEYVASSSVEDAFYRCPSKSYLS